MLYYARNKGRVAVLQQARLDQLPAKRWIVTTRRTKTGKNLESVLEVIRRQRFMYRVDTNICGKP